MRPVRFRSAFIVAAMTLLLTTACSRLTPSPASATYPNPYLSPQPFMEGIYAAERDVDPPATPRIRAVIVPHHLTATVSIASGIRMLARQNVKHIILLSPDHFHQCPTLACTVDGTFDTFFGTVRASTKTVTALLRSPLFRDDPSLFKTEHGIYAVLPYIAHEKPGVDVTPIALSQRLPWRDHASELLKTLAAVTDDDTVIVVSSDFSHYLTLPEAGREDEKTAEALFAGDLAGIAQLQNPQQSDCPNCVWLLASLARERGFDNPSTVLHTNSATILHLPSLRETTSHFSMVWYENAPLSGSDAAFGGDVTVTRGDAPPLKPDAAAWWTGNGPRVLNLEGPLASTCPPPGHTVFIFCNPLDRFRRVSGLATLWGVMNNHMLDQGKAGQKETLRLLASDQKTALTPSGADAGNLRIVALTNVMNPVPDAAAATLASTYAGAIARIRAWSKDQPVVVYVHAGREYAAILPDADRRYLQSFIDAGASAVIAVHSHIPSDMEIYKGKPIFHDLGNFLFDQYDRAVTRAVKIVRLRAQSGAMLFQTTGFHS